MKINQAKTQEQKNITWQQLSPIAQNVLEHCWLSVYSDRPTSGTFKFGDRLYKEKEVLTRNIAKEILDYQKENLDFNVIVDEETITVAGAYRENEMDTFDHCLTTNGEKALDVGDYLYKTTSTRMNQFQKVPIVRATKTLYVLNDRTKLKKQDIEQHVMHVHSAEEYVNVFYFRETNEIKKRYERQQLEVEFENWFHLESLEDEKLHRIIAILKEGESE